MFTAEEEEMSKRCQMCLRDEVQVEFSNLLRSLGTEVFTEPINSVLDLSVRTAFQK